MGRLKSGFCGQTKPALVGNCFVNIFTITLKSNYS